MALAIAVGGHVYFVQEQDAIATKHVPAVEAALELSTGLTKSLAELRGYMAIGEVASKERRESAWADLVWPALSRLTYLARGTGLEARVAGLRPMLENLREWQWYVEDTAHSAGDNVALFRLNDRGWPLANDGVQAVTGLIELEAQRGLQGNPMQLKILGDVRSGLTGSVGALSRYVANGRDDGLRQHEQLLTSTEQQLQKYAGGEKIRSAQAGALLNRLTSSLLAYRGMATDIISLRASRPTLQSADWLKNKAAPIALSADVEIAEIITKLRAARIKKTSAVASASDVSLAVALLLFALMALTALVLSTAQARRIAGPIAQLATVAARLERGDFQTKVPELGADEVRHLSHAFEGMRVGMQRALGELSNRNAVLDAEVARRKTLLLLSSSYVASSDALGFAVKGAGALAGVLWTGSRQFRPSAVLGRADPIADDDGVAVVPPWVLEASVSDQPVVLRDLPTAAALVQTGLLRTETMHVVLAPLRHDDVPLGVLELAFASAVDDDTVAFVERMGATLSLSIGAGNARAEALRRTEQARALNAELEAQRDELRAVNVDLEERADLLERSERTLQAQRDELRASNEELESQQMASVQQVRALEAASAELSRANEYKSTFLANMSHELRTPLNSVLILARLLERDEGKLSAARRKEFARTIASSGNDLLDLINDILDLAKIDAGRVQLTLEAVALADLLESQRNTFAVVAADKGVEFTTSVDPDLPATIETDARRVGQILRNLIGNAVKFTESGSVSVRVRPATDDELTRCSLGQPAIVVEVSDTGHGIPEDDLERIFNAFEQVDGSDTRKHGGTGLGLAISRSLARSMGGDIEARSEVGAGSNFVAVLPIVASPRDTDASAATHTSSKRSAPEPVTRNKAPDATSPDAEIPRNSGLEAIGGGDPDRRRLLIVEDDATLAQTLADLGREAGFPVSVAHTAAAALLDIERGPPAAVLLDIGLPDREGWVVAESMRANPATAHVPIHIVTGRMDIGARASRVGADVMQKPVPLDELRRVLDELSPGQGGLVLIVDDDQVEQRLLKRTLAAEGLESEAVGSLQSAMAALATGRFSSAIVDLGLGAESGLDLLQRLKSLPVQPRIVVHTGRELTKGELAELSHVSSTVVIKSKMSAQRVVGEIQMFLSKVAEQAKVVKVAPRSELTAGADLSEKRVLVADDDVRNVFALTAILEGAGMTVDIAQTGLEAIERMRENPADAILMDVMMPEMNGLDATRRLREDRRFARTPIIALTAKAMQGDRERCLAAGVSDYVTKPVEPAKLLNLLRVWLAQ